MFTTWMLLMLNGLFFSLRVGSTGSFPRPLKADEERECLERVAQGDMEARNKLIEHNLRLVAHIINKIYYKENVVYRTGFAVCRQKIKRIALGKRSGIRGVSLPHSFFV